MKSIFNRLYVAVLPKVLTLLGFSSTFAFMACYGPAPSDYHLTVFPGEVALSENGAKEQEVTISTEGEWTITSVPSFVAVSDTVGVGTANIVVTLKDVPAEGDSLVGSITVEGERSEEDIFVTVH